MQEIKGNTAYRRALKGRILDAALKAFIERGVKAVRMDDVAQSLSISKRTLYEIYKDKEELLYQSILKFDQDSKRSMAAFVQQAPSVMDIIIEAYKRRVLRTGSVNPLFYEDIQKYPIVSEYLENEREYARQQFFTFMQRGVQEGFFREDVDYKLIGQLYAAVNSYIMNQHLLKQYTIQQLFANMLLVPLRGFCTPKGLQVIEHSALTGNAQ
jgi:AcrR family transcriptional regulator